MDSTNRNPRVHSGSIKPTVFTYYEKIGTWDHRRLIDVWRENWSKAGFAPIVLGRSMAKRHPKYGEFIARIRTYPTINDRRYEDACYLRWLALSVGMQLAGESALMSDYDVFNQHFQAHDMRRTPVICHETTRVPCLVEATPFGAEWIIKFISSRVPPSEINHYSDMYAFKESTWPISGECVELGTPGWEKAPAVHAATGAIAREAPGQDKTEFIVRKFR